MDFERAALNSVCQVHPNTELKGCFYHFSSNIWKHIQNLGLQNPYQDDENFALWIRMLSALAFVPPNDVIRYFELLIDEIRNNLNDECSDLIDDFEDIYIGICFMTLKVRVLGELGNHGPFPFLLPPTFIQSDNCFIKNYSISFIFAFQEHQKCVFKASREAKMQTFPPMSTMVAPTINT